VIRHSQVISSFRALLENALSSPESNMNKQGLLAQVRALVAEVTRTRFEGGAYAKMMRAQGYADGYMRALQDAGLVDRNELLRAVGNGRVEVVGAPTAELTAMAG
jgi:hypothetical protein